MNWTPGPWKAEAHISKPPEIWARGMLVAKMAGQAGFDYANLDLMASAPELYEALAGLLSAAELHGTNGIEFHEWRNTGLELLRRLGANGQSKLTQ